MAGENRPPPHHLNEKLNASPWGFDFFEALRRMECSRPDLPPIGASQRLAEDPVRLGQKASLTFAPSSITGYEARESGLPPRLYVAFMGLLGPNGPMPLHITEYAHDRQHNAKDRTLSRFFDIFNHRMISFFYRAWAANQKAVHFERGEARRRALTAASAAPSVPGQTRIIPAAEDRFITFVYSTFGMGMPSMLERDELPDVAKAWFAGRLACQTRHAEGLQAIIADYFRVPCRIVQFIGQWLDIPKDCTLKLGESRRTGLLGQSTIIGSRMWDCQQRFRIRLGPLSLEQYERMLPPAPAYEGRPPPKKFTPGASLSRLRAWVGLYVGHERSWEVQLVLKKDEIPAPKLGGFGRLGWTTWLTSKPPTADASNLVLNP